MGLRKLFGVDHDPWPAIVVNDDSWSETEDGWRSSISELPIVTNRRQQEAVRNEESDALSKLSRQPVWHDE